MAFDNEGGGPTTTPPPPDVTQITPADDTANPSKVLEFSLLDEAFAGDMLTGPSFVKLRELGVDAIALTRIGQSAPMRVVYAEPAGRGLYRPSFTGSRCLQVAVMEAAEASPFAADSPDTVEINRVANLLAVPLSRPERYRLRQAGTFALGLPLVWSGRPVDVVETPLEWLRAGGDALCVLDWSPSWRFQMLMDALELRPTSKLLGIQLRAALARDGLPISEESK